MTTPFHLTLKHNSPDYQRLHRLAKKFSQPPSAITERHYELLTDKLAILNLMRHAEAFIRGYRVLSGNNRAQLNDLCNLLSTAQETYLARYKAFLYNLHLLINNTYDPQYVAPHSKYYLTAHNEFEAYKALHDTCRGTYDQRKAYSLAERLGVSVGMITKFYLHNVASPERTWNLVDDYVKLERLLSSINVAELHEKVNFSSQAFDDFERCLQSIGLKYNESVDNC